MAVPKIRSNYSYRRRIQAVNWLVLDNSLNMIGVTDMHYSPTQWSTEKRKTHPYDSFLEEAVAGRQELTIAFKQNDHELEFLANFSSLFPFWCFLKVVNPSKEETTRQNHHYRK